MEFETTTHCLNCHAKLSTPYCGQCGQKKAKRISFRELYRTLQRGILEFKSPFLVTLWLLTIKPGMVCREYIEGKRVKYFNPARYTFWLITLTVIICAYFDTPLINPELFFSESSDKEQNELQTLLYNFYQSGLLYFTFGYALLNAVSIKLLFRRHQNKLSELYILGLLPMANAMILAVILVFTGYYNTGEGQLFYSVSYVLYMCYSITTFYGKPKILNAFKSLIATLLSFILFALVIGVFAFIYGLYLGIPIS